MHDTATRAAESKPNVRRYAGGLGPEFQAMLYRTEQRHTLEAERGVRAWQLAPTIPIYLALMRGESVPLEQLNRAAVERYGLKGKASA